MADIETLTEEERGLAEEAIDAELVFASSEKARKRIARLRGALGLVLTASEDHGHAKRLAAAALQSDDAEGLA